MFKRVTMTFRPEELEALERLASQDLRPTRDQLRVLVRQEAQRRGLWPVTEEPGTPIEARQEVRA